MKFRNPRYKWMSAPCLSCDQRVIQVPAKLRLQGIRVSQFGLEQSFSLRESLSDLISVIDSPYHLLNLNITRGGRSVGLIRVVGCGLWVVGSG